MKKLGLLSPLTGHVCPGGGGRKGLELRPLRCHSGPMIYIAAPETVFSHYWRCPCHSSGAAYTLSAHHRLLEGDTGLSWVSKWYLCYDKSAGDR